MKTNKIVLWGYRADYDKYKPYDDSDIVCLPMWEMFSSTALAANIVATHRFPDINCIDPLKLLSLNSDFIRTIYE